MTEDELKDLLYRTPQIIEILTIIRRLTLSDSWLAAGSIRNLIWNYLSSKPLFDADTDVDVIFFDQAISYEETQDLAEPLKRHYPKYDWELRDQAHMHLHNPNTLPYLSASDAIAQFPEKCTAIGVRLTENDEVVICAPYGLSDIMQFIVRPTPYFLENPEKLAMYQNRLDQKKWQDKWPNLKIGYE